MDKMINDNYKDRTNDVQLIFQNWSIYQKYEKHEKLWKNILRPYIYSFQGL